MPGYVLVIGSRWLVRVVILGLWVAVDSCDVVGYNGRPVGGFVCYSMCWYVVLGYTGVATGVIVLKCPIAL